MGVNGLWTVLQPCARPTNLATLNRKRLAVDASIWIYQFLKAVRDKEGNALRNSHVVGFFRRICKLLWFGILPVFVFDGGAPALKRATIQKRQRRREGRRDDAVKTASKLLAVQMQRLAEEEKEKRRADREQRHAASREAPEPKPLDASQFVYVDEIGMSQKERQQNRKFHKTDAYHLPDLDGSIASMGQPDDPRIMSVEELEEYARQFNDGEDINLYDFSKIDFNGDFFKSLPPPDRYNILNAARLRSRLRMGLSKEQLDEMFPDRMAFSRFQIERVKERNHLTQRLMAEVGMTGLDLTIGVNARVAGEKNREYILVKNDGVEGGWALGVVSKEKDVGEAHKPIDVDAIQIQYQTKDEDNEGSEDDEDFEDVPIAGLNRLPPTSQLGASTLDAADEIAQRRQQFYQSQKPTEREADEEDSLFVGGNDDDLPVVSEGNNKQAVLHPEEEDDLNLAIALSLQNQHGMGQDEDAESEHEDGPMVKGPTWKQTAFEAAKPIPSYRGTTLARMVNNRANATVKKQAEMKAVEDSDSDEDMQTLLARARQAKKSEPARPVFENKKNPFDGPLPFPKLSWGSLNKTFTTNEKNKPEEKETHDTYFDDDDLMGGGFEAELLQSEEGPKPLPPWLADETDIRDSLLKQKDKEREFNAADREEAVEEERRRQRERMIEIDSSSEDDEDDVQIIEQPPPSSSVSNSNLQTVLSSAASTEDKPVEEDDTETNQRETTMISAESPEPEFEDVQIAATSEIEEPAVIVEATKDLNPLLDTSEQGPSSRTALVTVVPTEAADDQAGKENDEYLFGDAEEEEYSDPDEEALLEALELEAEEHARFASELNQKPAQQNRDDYERELRALRTQQKKDRRDADEVTQVMITECQALLRLFGIPYITAPMEAEAQCAELVRLGIVDGIVTDDSDTFLFGGTRVYKNMFSNNKFVECYLGSDLEKELSLSRDQLISLAHLLGSDYTEGIPGVGPVTAVEILSEFPGRDGLIDFRAWWTDVQSHKRPKEADADSSIRRKFRKSQAAKLFLPTGFPNPAVYDAYMEPDVDSSSEVFQWGVPDVEGLRKFLMATIGWDKERTDEVLVPVIRDMNKREQEGTQSNITRFFSGGVGVGAATEGFAPRQKAQGSKRMAAAVDNLRAKTGAGGVAMAGQSVTRSEPNKKRKTTSRQKPVNAEE